ncbi:MAG: hypothetical protein HY611_06685 [Elusimicrobia bacterium]|nr:hypothetical protein [Elusimicrobiota bacterium]
MLLLRLALVAAVAIFATFVMSRRDYHGAGGFEAFKHPEGVFECRFPKGWANHPAAYSATPQAVFVAPPPSTHKTSAMPSMWAYFYPHGSAAFKDPEAYIMAHTLPAEGTEIGPVEADKLENRPVMKFWVQRPLGNSPEDARRVMVREDYVVLTAAKGFFVLGLTWPLGEKAYEVEERVIRSQFDTFLKSFRFAP